MGFGVDYHLFETEGYFVDFHVDEFRDVDWIFEGFSDEPCLMLGLIMKDVLSMMAI